MRRCWWGCLLALIVPAAAIAAPPHDVIVNEYNAVQEGGELEPGKTDSRFGRRLENGGDWFELVVTQANVDMRGWQIDLRHRTGEVGEELVVLTLSQADIWVDLFPGTIITVAEDIPNTVNQYQPETGTWWFNVRADDSAAGTYITASNFKVSNDKTQITVKNNSGVTLFGPAGEGIEPRAGVGNDEVWKLEADPSPSIIPTSSYNDGTSSSFGLPNQWTDAGTPNEQDFSVLRAGVPYSPLTSVVVNEVNTHSDLPLVDWIELYNTTNAAIDVGGWFLSDGTNDLQEYEIPASTVIPAHGFLHIEHDVTGVSGFPFGLNGETGDEVFLSVGDGIGGMTGERNFVEFGPAENGVSMGRYPNGAGELHRLQSRTPDATNTQPLVGPVVINELMYNPDNLATLPASMTSLNELEYVELYNTSASSVDLWTPYALPAGDKGWRLTGGVDIEFSVGTTMPADSYLLVVSFDPVVETAKLADFRSFYGIAGSVPVVGPYGGGLNDYTETVRLRLPDVPSTVSPYDSPYVIWDTVTYFDWDEWPTEPDGSGPSLERIDPYGVADPPSNWGVSQLALGTPGALNQPIVPLVPSLAPFGRILLAVLIAAIGVPLVRRWA
jgi:hypothetical protein